MITKERLAELRTCHERFVNGHGTAADGAVILHNTTELLDAAESEIRLRESIAITDRNFRAMQAERDELRVKLQIAIDVLEDVSGDLYNMGCVEVERRVDKAIARLS